MLVWNTDLCLIRSKRLCFYFVFFPTVKGRLFEVKELFLEDVLKLVDFRNKGMLKHKEEAQKSTELWSMAPASVAFIFHWFSSWWFHHLVFRWEEADKLNRVVWDGKDSWWRGRGDVGAESWSSWGQHCLGQRGRQLELSGRRTGRSTAVCFGGKQQQTNNWRVWSGV